MVTLKITYCDYRKGIVARAENRERRIKRHCGIG